MNETPCPSNVESMGHIDIFENVLMHQYFRRKVISSNAFSLKSMNKSITHRYANEIESRIYISVRMCQQRSIYIYECRQT